MSMSGSGGFDWRALFDRLEAFRSSLERGLTRDAGQRNEELRRRAAELARKPEAVADTGNAAEALVFAVGSERYAIAVEHIVEIQPLRQLTPLPGSPQWILGIVHLGGRILPVFDLLPILHKPDKGLSERDKVVVVRHGADELGVLATEVVGLQAISRPAADESASAVPSGASPNVSFVTGDGVIVLDPDSLFLEGNLAPAEE